MKKGIVSLVAFVVVSSFLFGPLAVPSHDTAFGQEMKGDKMKMGGKSMEMKPGMKMEMAKKGIFTGVGKIIAIVPKKNQIVVGHEEIKGFMKAMPMGMGYSVKSADLLKKVKPGDPVKFKIDASIKKIISIDVIEKR